MADKLGTFEVGRTSGGHTTISLNGDTAAVQVGSGPQRPQPGQHGQLDVVAEDGQLLIRLGRSLLDGGGHLQVYDDKGQSTVTLRGGSAGIRTGGSGQDGDVTVQNAAGESTIRLQSGEGTIRVGGGAQGPDGDLVLYSAKLEDSATPKGTVHLDGGTARARLGGHSTSGSLLLFAAGANMSDERNATVLVDGAKADCWIGGNGVNGDIMLFGANSTGADVRNADKASIRLDGAQGDIVLRNADCAEDFDVAAPVAPGNVMVLGDGGRLRRCDKAYDKAVVGVVSGAGRFKAALVLDRRDAASTDRQPIALMGKTYCRVDASKGAVAVGDLLTTSDVPGHAMVASDPSRAFGAILGKALEPLADGRQLIPILVTLQ